MDTINKYIDQSKPRLEPNGTHISKGIPSIHIGEESTGVKIEPNYITEQYKENVTKNRALRFDEGKLRYDLLHPVAQEGLVKILTKGAKKYDQRNWEKGMKWSKVLGSLKRHLAAIERGEDYDEEFQELHVNLLQANAHFLSAYYKIYPEGDDRPHKYLTPKRIGLDIDDVLADWCCTFCKLANVETPKNWNFGFPNIVKKLIDEGLNYQEVMENLPMRTRPEDIPFEPVVYITHRSHTPVEVAERWIAKNGYAQAPVVQTADKIQACIDHKIDIFVDDKYDTFVQMNKAGICCFLFDAPHNQRYDVGHKRIHSLKELV